MMGRFSGETLDVTAHMIIISACSLAERKYILTRTCKEQRVMHSENWQILEF